MQNYCEHLYDESTDGYIHLIKIDKDKQVKIYNTNNAALKEIVEEVVGEEDIFIAPNTMFIPKRQVNNIRQFRALFLDLDNLEGDKHYTSYQLFELAELGIIPRPTMIVDSGRGLHIYWRIKNAPYGALHTWQEIEDMLYHKLKVYGADIKATDGARVLRLPSTINSKNNDECKVLWIDSEKEYSMYDLREEYLSHKYKKYIAKANRENKKLITNSFYNSYSLHITRAEDLLELCELRKYKVKGLRNMILHCYAYWKGIYIRDTELLTCEVNELNSKFNEPMNATEVNAILRCIPKAIERFISYEQGVRAGEVKRVTKGMRDKEGYWYKNETLIERLGITEDEQRNLKTIIGTRVKYDRNNVKRCKERRNENGLTNKQQELKALKTVIIEFKLTGLSNRAIARKLNISESKVRTTLKK
ncbi:MAG: DNA-binding response regulator [Bacilli bacterium]